MRGAPKASGPETSDLRQAGYPRLGPPSGGARRCCVDPSPGWNRAPEGRRSDTGTQPNPSMPQLHGGLVETVTFGLVRDHWISAHWQLEAKQPKSRTSQVRIARVQEGTYVRKYRQFRRHPIPADGTAAWPAPALLAVPLPRPRRRRRCLSPSLPLPRTTVSRRADLSQRFGLVRPPSTVISKVKSYRWSLLAAPGDTCALWRVIEEIPSSCPSVVGQRQDGLAMLGRGHGVRETEVRRQHHRTDAMRERKINAIVNRVVEH